MEFAASEIGLEDGRKVRVSVSIGVALFRPDRETIEDTIRRADAALYDAKGEGSDRVVSAEAIELG